MEYYFVKIECFYSVKLFIYKCGDVLGLYNESCEFLKYIVLLLSIFFFFNVMVLLCMYVLLLLVSMSVHHTRASACGGENKALGFLELKL